MQRNVGGHRRSAGDGGGRRRPPMGGSGQPRGVRRARPVGWVVCDQTHPRRVYSRVDDEGERTVHVFRHREDAEDLLPRIRRGAGWRIELFVVEVDVTELVRSCTTSATRVLLRGSSRDRLLSDRTFPPVKRVDASMYRALEEAYARNIWDDDEFESYSRSQ